jgi:catechol 2,3-dioxygenase-like lactoylglutathione lyase family enzyme/heme-degrading monooxygenase HmoA
MTILYDHVDVRVRDLERAARFYDPLCRELGLTTISPSPGWRYYEPSDGSVLMFVLTEDPQHRAASTRVAFRGETRGDVDRIAQAALDAGATAFEPPALCPEYTPSYYASFFEDPDGNRYEVCHRGDDAPRIARLWRGRVRSGALREYRAYVESTGMREYRATRGNRGAYLLTRECPEHGEVATISFWESLESTKAFAGEDVECARYYPKDELYLLDFPKQVEHFDC